MLKPDSLSTTPGESARALAGIDHNRRLRGFIPGSPIFSIAMVTIACGAVACATTKPRPTTATQPFEPGSGACRATLKSAQNEGLIRYVDSGEETREIWDTDGDGSPERELRKVHDRQGRVIQIEQFDSTGRVIERIEREFDGDRLVAEKGDRFDEEGRPGPDGSPDWVRQLEWKEGRLVTEYVDETKDGLPGIDGEPEFVTTWSWENGRQIAGEKRHDGMVVASFEREYSGGRLQRETADWGADGTVDEETVYQYDAQGRVKRMEHRARNGGYIATYAYDCGD